MKAIGLILLAAGGSTRMGRPKQLLPYAGNPLIRHAALAALETSCRPVIAVLGAERERCAEALHGLPVTLIENEAWEEGLASSIRAGVGALAAMPEIGAALITLHDQPRITGAMLERLVEAWNRSATPIVASSYGETLGVPALFSRALFPELMALNGAEGAKKVIVRQEGKVCAVDMPEAATDVDTPRDYERLRNAENPPLAQ